MLVELIDHKKTEIGLFKAQFVAQNTETRRFKELLSEADLELEVCKRSV